jgi:hypothetical protein
MQSTISTPITLLILSFVLFGWLVSDCRIGDAVYAIVATTNNATSLADKIVFAPVTTTPNIDTNWFSGSSNVSYQLPTAQTRQNDDDEHIAQGRIVGDSFGKDGDL